MNLGNSVENEVFSRKVRDSGCRVKVEAIRKLRLAEEIAHNEGKAYLRQLPPPANITTLRQAGKNYWTLRDISQRSLSRILWGACL